MEYMKKAICLAKLGCGHVNPNPLVGAVIVKNDKIIAEGYHEKYGGFHAERNAILSCKEDMSGADLYVTLEPCCHYGKTPPCTDIIIKSGIKRVFVGCLDDNPLVKGKGCEILRNNGIEVIENVMYDECRRLNEIFFHYINTGMPYIIMKYAMTADGKISTSTGKSKWITSEPSRQWVHRLRGRTAGILVGSGTVKTDNPMLNCRIENGSNPVRIICDSRLDIPLDSAIIQTSSEIKTIIAAVGGYSSDKAKAIKNMGAEIIDCPDKTGKRVDLPTLLKKLGTLKIDSILVEGGSEINYSMLKSGLANKLYVFVAPKIFGGSAKTPIGGTGIDEIMECCQLKPVKIKLIDDDTLIEYSIEKPLEDKII